MDWQAIWHRLTTTRYVAMLEDEVDRLREENRGLLNSLLTRAGVQPIDKPSPMPQVGRRMSRNQRQVQIERDYLARQAKPDA